MINMRGDRILELRNGASPAEVGPEITAAREKITIITILQKFFPKV